MQSVTLMTGAWYHEREITIGFPDDWDVQTVKFQDRAVATDELIRAAFNSPIGTSRISELARGQKNAVILCDDLSRPTPASRLLPEIVEDLHEGGLRDDDILVMMGLGCHRPMSRDALTKKLGEEIVQRFRVRQNELDDAFIHLGTTSRGTPVNINQWVMECDLKIGVSTAEPHRTVGFSGGGKLIMPGAANWDSINALHVGLKPGEFGGSLENEQRLDLEEAARMAGLDVSVLVVLNWKRQITDVLVGDMVQAHRAAVKIAREVYSVDPIDGADIVVVTGYPRDNDLDFSGTGAWPLWRARAKATKILIAEATEGRGYHRFDIVDSRRRREAEGRERDRRYPWAPTPVNPQYVFLSPIVGPAELRDSHPKAVLRRSWEQVLEELQKTYHGRRPKVAVYVSSGVSYPRPSKIETVKKFYSRVRSWLPEREYGR
jgi:lactate racemase